VVSVTVTRNAFSFAPTAVSFPLHKLKFQYKLPSNPIASTLLQKQRRRFLDDQVMRHRIHFALILLLVGTVPFTVAKGVTAFRSVTWTPQELQSGSVCLFAVQLEGSPAKLSAKWMGRDVSFFQGRDGHEWYGLAGVDVEALLSRDVQVGPSNYKTVSLRVPDRFVKPDAAALRRIEADKQAKDIAFSHQIPTPEWSGDFRAPIGSVVSDSFGTRRVFNGKLVSVHRGLDFRAKPGSPVLAANSGEVVLARKLFYEGNCVIIDHGEGFMTLYMHLSRFKVAEGQKVTKGQEIGLSGATGRATGPHLHMGVRWEGAYLDPASLLSLTLGNLP
jgi:murein DD-endopeptidase MepM/ murein hydrolase activator NlpD